MIVKDHVASYERLRRYCLSPMLMLGRQSNTCGFDFGTPYRTLDPDGGDYPIDITAIGPDLPKTFGTVFDLGTLEHVWNTHAAYINAADCVRRDGFFLGQTPVAGWEGHGIHVTSAWAVQDFFALNGFKLLDVWYTTQAGAPYIESIKRNCGKSILMWYVAQRATIVDEWRAPSQVYENGAKPAR